MPLALYVPNFTELTYCCCPEAQNTYEIYPLEVTRSIQGYLSNTNIRIEGIDYNAQIEIAHAGDTLEGTANMTKIRGRKLISNRLFPQRSSFPNLPINHEWGAIKLTGYKHHALLRLFDETPIVPPQDNLTQSLTLNMELLVLRDSDLIGQAQKTAQLRGSDLTSWSSTRPIELVLPVEVETIGIRETLIYSFAITPTVKVFAEAVQIFGEVKSKVDPINVDPIEVTRRFTSSLAVRDVSFPWSQSWILTDTQNVSQSLINPQSLVFFLPDGYRLSLNISLVGNN